MHGIFSDGCPLSLLISEILRKFRGYTEIIGGGFRAWEIDRDKRAGSRVRGAGKIRRGKEAYLCDSGV